MFHLTFSEASALVYIYIAILAQAPGINANILNMLQINRIMRNQTASFAVLQSKHPMEADNVFSRSQLVQVDGKICRAKLAVQRSVRAKLAVGQAEPKTLRGIVRMKSSDLLDPCQTPKKFG